MRFPRPAPASALLTVALVVPTAVVAPSFTAGSPEPHPVSPQTQRLQVSGVDASEFRAAIAPDEVAKAWRDLTNRTSTGAEAAAGREPEVLTEELETDSFRMLGVTWRGAPPSSDSAVIVTARTRTDGEWTDWFDVHTMVDTGTEPSPNGRFGTEPHWVGDSDGVQVRIDAVGGAKPTDVRADLIEPGTSDADAAIAGSWQGSTASASTSRPPIVTRAQWGADESLRDKRLENNPTVEVAFVHHTAGSNSYTRGESPAVVRGLYSYYVNSLDYADMGYNFLVDKYGTIYEGRAGSITKPVRSAATGGFNTNSLSIVAMGNFETAPASDAMVAGIAKVAGYRLSRFYRDPFGRRTLKAEVGSSRYSAGRKVSFKVISGHRDAGYTACPGGNLYRRLPDIRRQAAKAMGSSLIEPSISRRSTAMGQDPEFTIRSRVNQRQKWTLTVRQRCSKEVVRRFSGTAAPGNPIRAVWRGRNDQGNLAPAGRYRLTLTSSADGTSAWPYAAAVVMGVGGSADASTRTTLPTPAGTYVPQQPRALLSSTTGLGVNGRLVLGAGRKLDVNVLGRAGVPNSGVSAVAVSVEATCSSAPTRIFAGPDSVEGAGARVLSVGRNSTASGFSIIRVGPDGGIRFHNASGAVALRASVVGYVSTSGAGGSLIAQRRTALGGAHPLTVGTTARTVDVAGRAGVPDDAKAVVLAVRRGGGSNVGAVWAWPESGTKPAAPAWRRARGTAHVGQIIVPLGSTGQLRIAADRSGPISLEVAGYVSASDDRALHAVVPRALLGDGASLKRGSARTVSVAGRAGVPRDAQAVVVSVTGSARKRSGHLSLWPRGGTEPRTGDVVVPKHRSSESLAVVRLGVGGDVRLKARDASLRGNVTVVGWIR